MTEINKKAKLSDVLRNHNFSMIFLGGLISDIGSNFSYIAFMFLAISYTSNLGTSASAQAVAVIMIFQIIPSVLLGPFAGVLVDRFDRKKLMIYADIFGAITIFSVLLTTNIYQLYVISFFSAITRLFFYPARGASIPKIVESNQFVQANGIIQTMTQLSGLIGPALAGLIIFNFGYNTAFIIDGVSFLVSGLMIFVITTDLKPESDGNKVDIKQIIKDMRLGLSIILDDKIIKYILALFLLLLLGIGMINPLLAFYLKNSFNLTERDFGYLISFSAVSGFIGAMIMTIKGEIKRKITMITSSTFIIAVSLSLLGFAPNTKFPVISLYVAMAIIGVINISINIPLSSLFMAIIEDKNLGKINAFMGVALALSQVSAAAIAALLAGFINISYILIGVGIFTGFVGVLGMVFIMVTDLESLAQQREEDNIKRKRKLKEEKEKEKLKKEELEISNNKSNAAAHEILK